MANELGCDASNEPIEVKLIAAAADAGVVNVTPEKCERIRDLISRHWVMMAKKWTRCGQNTMLDPLTVGGCGGDMDIWDAYRCVDCNIRFHKGCIKKHWDKKLTEEDIARECP